MSYRLVFDACNDLSPHYDVQEGVEIVPLAYEIDGKRYLRYQDDRELSVDEFYKLGKDGKYGKTSQVPPSDFQAAARRYLKRGEDVFLMPFSSGLSGTYQSALVAKSALEEEFPQRKIVCFDSLAAAPCYSAMIVKAVALWKEGVPLEDLSKRLYEHRKHLHTWFAVDDLGALIHGGRLGKVAGFFAGALKIKPVMILDGQGKLALAAKAHGRVKAIEAIASAMRSTITPEGRKLPIYCDYGEDASLAAEVVRKAKEEVDANLIFFQGRVSPVIGIHTGPSIIAVTWYGTEQEIGGN